MKVKRKRVKLAEILAGLHGRYKWVGAWPAIPVKLRWDERAPRREPSVTPPVDVCQGQPDGSIKRFTVQFPPIPPDATPAWVENIYERLFEKILPPKQRATEALTVEFCDAAILGYAYAALSRVRASRLKACKTLPPDAQDGKVPECDRWEQYYAGPLAAYRRQIDEVLAGWELPDAANYLEGFAYGIACQQREAGWIPSATTETLQIYKALVENQHAIEELIHQKATAREIGEYIAEHAVMSSGMTYAKYFQKNPNSDAKETFLKTVQQVFGRLRIPLPRPGRPRRNSDTQ